VKTDGISLASVSQLPAELALRVDQVVDAFEADWRAAHRAGASALDLAEYVERVDSLARPALAERLRKLGEELAGGVRTEPREDHPWPVVPGYEILGYIDGGGMGSVYRARERGGDSPEVAIKVIRHAELARSRRQRAIWEVEGEVVAALQHDNIVRIEKFGDHGGEHYLVMELVEGGDLRKRFDEFRLDRPVSDPEQRSRRCAAALLLEKVARAVHHVHQRGVFHRDLKPSNILLEGDEPKVCDFGLARRRDESLAITRTGQILGTLPYMAPEQAAAARGQALTVAADIWSLGAILYELLSGDPPFTADGPDAGELLRRKAACDLSTLALPGNDPDLEWICLKCLHRNPAERFASAGDLAEALNRYRQGKRVRKDEPVLDRLHRWVVGPLNREPADRNYIDRWKHCLRAEACTLLFCHAGMFVLVWNGAPGWQLWGWFICLDTLLGWLIYLPWLRRRRLSLMEQGVAQMWLGADLAVVALSLIFCPPWGAGELEAVAGFYASCAVTRGLVFFIEGRVCWGRLHLTGLALFALGVAISLTPAVAPLLYGAACSGLFAWLSCRRWKSS
jgi:serine/threonine-protein kinase